MHGHRDGHNESTDETLALLALLRGTQVVTQPLWVIDPINGNDTTATGSLASPFKTAAAVYSHWQNGIVGTRPQLAPTGGLLTVLVVNDQPDTSDPIGVLWNVDVRKGDHVLIEGALGGVPGAGHVLHTGTFSAAVIGTRSPTQWEVSDGALNWTPFLNLLLIDTTTGSLSYVDNTTGLPAGSVFISWPRSPLNPLVPFGNPSPLTVAAGNNYQVVDPVHVYLGNAEFTTSLENNTAEDMAITGYRLHFTSIAPLGVEFINAFSDGNVALVFKECLFDPIPFVTMGIFLCHNCFYAAGMQTANGADNPEFVSGLSKGPAVLSGSSLLDGDIKFSLANVRALTGCELTLGDVGVFTTGQPALVSFGLDASIQLAPEFFPEGVFYGTCTGAVANLVDSTYMTYAGTAAGSFSFNISNFTLAGSPNAFRFDPVAAAYIAPALAVTVANLDAALPAGFGGQANDPRTLTHLGVVV